MTAAGALAGLRVLVVEDDYYLASDTRRLFERAGANVVGPAGSLEEASGLAADGDIDCALIDINLGAGPTFAVARTLRDRGIPFLFTTGYDAIAIPGEYRDVPRIEKPMADRALLAALERLAK